MKQILWLFLLGLLFLNAYSQDKINVIVIGAHPDDCDIDAGGTAIHFSKMGHNVLFVSLTNGDAGHHELGGGALAKRRMAEAQEAGKRFGVQYNVLDNHDGELMPTLENRKSRSQKCCDLSSGCCLYGDCAEHSARCSSLRKESCFSVFN